MVTECSRKHYFCEHCDGLHCELDGVPAGLESLMVTDEPHEGETITIEIQIEGVALPVVRKFLCSALLVERFAFIRGASNFVSRITSRWRRARTLYALATRLPSRRPA